jgi:hypothetical protein
VVLGAASAGETAKVETLHLSRVERLRRRERPVMEVGIGSEEVDPNSVAGKRSQRDHRLERRYAASGEEDVKRCVAVRPHSGMVACPNEAGLRTDQHRSCGKTLI